MLFTTFLTNPEGCGRASTGLDYWLGQQDVGRGGEPRYFYFVVLFGHEWPALLLGAIGMVVACAARRCCGIFLVWAFVVSLAVYSWAGEKFAWLVLHPLLPLLLLAGVGVQAIWDARGHWTVGRRAVVVVACLAYVGVRVVPRSTPSTAPTRASCSSRPSPRRTSSASPTQVLARGEGAAQADRPITVDSAEGATFPWAWYFRDLPVGYIDLVDADGPPPDSDVLILTQAAATALGPELTGYTAREFPFRVWWVRDYDKMSPPGWLALVH